MILPFTATFSIDRGEDYQRAFPADVSRPQTTGGRESFSQPALSLSTKFHIRGSKRLKGQALIVGHAGFGECITRLRAAFDPWSSFQAGGARSMWNGLCLASKSARIGRGIVRTEMNTAGVYRNGASGSRRDR